MTYVRERLDTDVLTSADLLQVPDGTEVKVAGMVIRRQRPLAKAVFITLEDEHGHIPFVVWPATYSSLRNILKAPFVLATGTVSRREGTMNIVVTEARPLQVLGAAPEARDFR